MKDEARNIPRWEQKLQSFTKALTRLAHIVNESQRRPLNEFEVDSIVQRFEFTHEIAWKLMKSYAEFQGETAISGSRDASRWAFENHLVTDGHIWMEMIRSRNETSHNYDETVTSEIIDRVVKQYYPALLALQQKMTTIAQNTPNDLFSEA